MKKTILITGASSGIGKELAIQYSNSDTTLLLTARRKDKLQETKKLCQEKGAKVISKVLDVRQKEETANWINTNSKKYGLDLVIANAGISAGTEGGPESDEQVEAIFDTNVAGVLNTINPAIKYMKENGGGQIGVISSLAGFKGLPSSPAYSASKSAVRVYCEGLRGNLRKFNIKVSAICPGYIRTPMTDVNNFPMPFIMDVNKAAKIIIKGLQQDKSRIAFPFPFYFCVWLVSLLSPKITDPFFAKLPGKKSIKS